MHAPEFQGRLFSEGSEAAQAAQHTRTLLGDAETGKQIKQIGHKSTEMNKTRRVHAPKFQERAFSGGSGRRRQRNTRTLLGDPKTNTNI